MILALVVGCILIFRSVLHYDASGRLHPTRSRDFSICTTRLVCFPRGVMGAPNGLELEVCFPHYQDFLRWTGVVAARAHYVIPLLHV